MLGLKLRKEFSSSQMQGAQIVLDRVVHAGTVDDILSITYPTSDVRNALRAVGSGTGRPMTIIGERGRGKSHILGLLHYAFLLPDHVQTWAGDWANDVKDRAFGALNLPSGFTPISVVISNWEYPTLWAPIFKWLRNGSVYSQRFEASGNPVPSRSLMEELFTAEPAALILDEVQTWYETLRPSTSGGSERDLQFNFIQILSELAADRPDILRLVVSVRNSETDAYRQIHRVNPVLIDFKGVEAREDRIHLTQHRLFENYRQIPQSAIEAAVAPYAAERIRLLYQNVSGPAQDERRREVLDAWPFAPELLDILEDEILMAAAAQETRDLIRILAKMYKARGNDVPLLSVADINITDESGAGADLASMVDTVVGGGRLREVAQRNLEAIGDQGLPLPHAEEIITALWVRSLAQGPSPGATPRQLHLDITRERTIDDNAFDDELQKLKDASFNIHVVGERLVFRREENPQAKLQASARNDKLFTRGQDLAYIQRAIAQALSPIDSATVVASRLIVMDQDWNIQPWSGRSADELPAAWREPVVIVLPEHVSDERLARWLVEKVSARRNLVRFLMPNATRGNPYTDREVRELARCALLAEEWGRSDPQYQALRATYQKPLRERLSRWFDRLAVLRRWSFTNPGQTRFDNDTINPNGQGVLKAIEDHISVAIFEPTVFQAYVRQQAAKQRSAFDIIEDLTEPPAVSEQTVIPFLGQDVLYERMLRMVAEGEIILNVKGVWVRREPSDFDTQTVLQRIRQQAYRTGRYLLEVMVALPSAAAAQPQPPTSDGSSTQVGSGMTQSSGTAVASYPLAGGTRPSDIATTTTNARSTTKTYRSSGARTPINLKGDLHSWELSDGALQTVRLSGTSITLSQLKDLLNRLPPSIKFILEVDTLEEQS